jgi:TonB family protein
MIRVSERLIHLAAGRAPESLSQRLEEEWLADLSARPTPMSRLRFAIGCCWASGVIAFEHQPTEAPVMIAHAQHQAGFLSRRSGTLMLVVSLHAAVFYGLMTTLAHRAGNAVPAPLQNRLLDNPLHEPPPPLPTPQLHNWRIPTDIPKFEVPREPDPIHDTATDVVQDPPRTLPAPPPPPSSEHMVTQVQGGPGKGFPNPDDFYPGLARRLEEQGMATVKVCVDVNGRLTADPTTLRSSGSARLDEGALRLARAGSGHFRPTTEDGKPVNSCYPLAIRFQLKN